MNRHKDLLNCCDGYFHRNELKYNEREPYSPTIYFLTRNGKIVYIGETGSPAQRFKTHTQKTPAYKEWDKVFFKTFDEYVKGIHLRYLESRAMTYLSELPEYNRLLNRIGDQNENPFTASILNEYLLKVQVEVLSWELKFEKEKNIEQREVIRHYQDLFYNQ
jgi:hypothetical protein